MSIYYTLRSYWWDTVLLVRHLRRQQPLQSLWWGFLNAWESATPSFYNKIQTAYRQKRPLPVVEEETVPPETYGTVATVEGIKMRLDPRMSGFQVKKLLCGRHTRHERQLVVGRLEPDDIVMELGGGIGMLSTACALKIGGDRIHSYEANPTMESLIYDNYALNGVKPHLKMCMLDENPGSCTFYASEHFARSSAYKLNDQGETTAYEVPVESLNDEIHRIKPTVLIMDVQGSEGRLLSFADLSTVRKLLVELHPNVLGIFRVNGLRRQLRNQGFSEVERAGQSFLYIRQ
ncbi:MAG: FkbM family methyltransferase [Cyanobacteriota bacterium]|nr:FkbM family methyltransferase [Cyanobacteriota bacterium]